MLETMDPAGNLLWQCFSATAHNFTYEDGPEDPTGDWVPAFALAMFEKGQGNCMQYASVFYLLAQACGFDAQIVVGDVLTYDEGWALHGWVEIRQDGAVYICDPTMENGLWGGNWYMVSYAQAPASYRLDGELCAPEPAALPSADSSAVYDELLELDGGGSAELLLTNDSALTLTGLSLLLPAKDDFPQLTPATDLALAPGETLLVRYEPPPETEGWLNIVVREYRDLQVSFDGTSSYLIHDIDLTMMEHASLGFEASVAFLSYDDAGWRSPGGRASTFEAERGRRAFFDTPDASKGSRNPDEGGAPNPDEGGAPNPGFDQDSDACLDDPIVR
jgi:hypothetical protein